MANSMKKYYVILKLIVILIATFSVFGSNYLQNWNTGALAATTVVDPGTSTATPDINSLLDKLKNGTLTAEDQQNLNKLLGDNGNQLDLLNSVAKQSTPTTKAASTTQTNPTTTTTNTTTSNSTVTTIELIFIIFSALLLWLNLILLIIYLWQRIRLADIQKNIPS